MKNVYNDFVSVIMPVYNGSLWVAESIKSILAQSHRNFEFIIIDDGSADSSDKIISSFVDDRIRFIKQENIGLPRTLNLALTLCSGEFIFRQDQDDISHPKRLELQLSVLKEHPSIDLCGCWAYVFNGARSSGFRLHRQPMSSGAIATTCLVANPFFHSGIAIRSAQLIDAVGYSTDLSRSPPEDYELWSRILRVGKGFNIPTVLLYYREVPSGISRQSREAITRNQIILAAENIYHWAIQSRQSATLEVAAALSRILLDPVQVCDVKYEVLTLKRLLIAAFIGIRKKTERCEESKLIERRLLRLLHRNYELICSRNLLSRVSTKIKWRIINIPEGRFYV